MGVNHRTSDTKSFLVKSSPRLKWSMERAITKWVGSLFDYLMTRTEKDDCLCMSTFTA